MLIHKATMGVLDRIWTGQHTRGPDGVLSPVERPAVPSDVDRPEDWWEIPSNGPLAKTVRLHYPWIIPQTGPSGELVGVILPVSEERQEAAERARERKVAKTQEAARRGYRTAGRVRSLGLMPFLNSNSVKNSQ